MNAPSRQLTRTDDLIDRVGSAATRQGRSTNEDVTVVLAAATDPDLEDSETWRLTEELGRAVLVTHDVLDAAAGLTAAHGLRAHDTGLRAAAAAEGLRLLPAWQQPWCAVMT